MRKDDFLYVKTLKASVFGQAIETTCIAIIILYYVLAFDISKFSLAIIAEITANLVIVTSAISNVKKIAHSLSFHNENIIALENENADITLILDKYLFDKKMIIEILFYYHFFIYLNLKKFLIFSIILLKIFLLVISII